MTHRFWSKRFRSHPDIVGRVILLNRQPFTVVGVMPASFQGLFPGREIDLFVPMSAVPATATYYSLTPPDRWWVQIFGRLKLGVSDAAAAAVVQSALAHQIESYVSAQGSIYAPQIVLEPGSRGTALLRTSLKTALYILTAITLLVLLIACTNLASLLLARYSARTREIAIRVSIGAGRWRLIRQMLTESMLLALAGAATGLLLANPLLRLLVHSFSSRYTLGIDPQLDTRSVAFTLALCLVTVLLFGTMPAWRVSNTNLGPGLKEFPGVAAGTSPRFLLGRYLVSIQIALSLLLLTGTGLFLRTLRNLAAVDLGFQTENILTFQTDPGRIGYKSSQLAALYRRLEAHLAVVPGVEAVGISQHPLIGDIVSNGAVRLPASGAKKKQTWFLYCSNSFLSTMKIPLLYGRDLTDADFDRAAHNAVVNETFVKKYLPSLNPLGQIFYLPDREENGASAKPVTIVGVAKDAHYDGVRKTVPPTAYLPYGLRPFLITAMNFAIRTRLEPLSLGLDVRRAVSSVDPNLPISKMRTERDQIDRSLGPERLFATLITSFGVIAIALAAIGLYGVMAFSVAGRTSEIGIRMALGAERRDVRWLILRQSLLIAALGISIGVPSALMLTRLIKERLYGVQPNDPISLIGAAIMIAAITVLAAWIPARRASRVDPVVALRCQ